MGHALDSTVKARLWKSFQGKCRQFHLDYRDATLSNLIKTIDDSHNHATPDAQCIRMLHALHVAQGREHSCIIPLDPQPDLSDVVDTDGREVVGEW